MLEQLLFLTAVMLGVTFVRLVRRLDGTQRGYMLLVGGLLCLALVAMVQHSRYLAVVAIGIASVAVVFPWALEAAARSAFSRGRLSLAVWFAGVRALLMPGAGLGRQQEILRGLALLERAGVDRALDHFRHLVERTEDGGELAIINEQIVAMLFYGQRWEEGIAHYEARFHPRYAAMRPALALGLLRAYGESGKLEHAAGLLRALEDGPMGADPRALSVLSQARLTFLAYAGASRPVTRALTDERRRLLGLSAASSALFRGIALARAGELDRAFEELQRVQAVAAGGDDRIVDASRTTLARLRTESADDGQVDLGPELRRYVEMVAERLEMFFRAAPRSRRTGTLFATPLLMLGVLAGDLLVLGIDRGGVGLLVAGGITPELWASGRWSRLFVAPFVQADPIGMLLVVYALWIAGPLIERLAGRARLVVAAVGGGAFGLLVSVLSGWDPGAVLGGGSMMAAAVAAGASWVLLPAWSPALPTRSRRAMALPLALVLVALLGTAAGSLLAADVPVAGLLASMAFGVIVVGLVPSEGAVARIVGLVAVPLGLAVALGIHAVATDDIERFTAEHRTRTLDHRGVRFELPRTWSLATAASRPELPLPQSEGLVDTLARRSGRLAQLVVSAPRPSMDARAPDPEPGPRVLVANPVLGREVIAVPREAPPEAFAEAYAAAGGDVTALSTFALRRNGAEVGRIIERAVGDRIVALVVSPSEALLDAPSVLAAVLADAVPVPDR